MPDLPILDELGGDLRTAFRRRERRRRRRWAALPVAAVAGAAALLIGLGSGSVAPRPATATAAELLRRAAHAARTAPAPFPRADQYFYVRSLATNLSTPEPPVPGKAKLVTKERQVWTSLSRPGHLREKSASGELKTFPLGRARYRLGSIDLTRRQLLDFPTDPRTIYERLRAQVGSRGRSPEGEVFTEIGDALRESPAPAGLRAGLYGALALIPGVVRAGDVTDRAGRRGVAVAFTEAGERSELIFDPATSEMLAERTVLTRPRPEYGFAAGTVITDTAYLERGVVDELP
jgi:hypothetical protein